MAFMKLIKAMATVAGLTGLSRVAGFVRDILTAAILGAGPVADAFFVALKLPNFFRRVTAEGAFSVSFVPLYSRILEKEGRKKADSFAVNIFFIMLSWLTGFIIVALFLMPWVIYGIAPGFHDDPVRYGLAVDLARVTFPYLLMMSLTALLGGVLNALDRFAPFAFAPVLFNLALIGALLLNKEFQTAGHAMAWGVLAAGFLQFLWLVFAARRAGFALRLVRPRLDGNAKEVLRLMGPGVVGAGVMHINLFADLIIASFLATGSISYLYYADRLNQLPLGVVGIAVGTALLPMLSRAIAAKKTAQAQDLLNRALEYCFLLALPAAVALAVIPALLIGVLFERGAFDSGDTALTGAVLRAYALGLPAYIAVKVFSTVHWARGDTLTPVKISVLGTILNIILSLILIHWLGVAGIALATGFAGWVQFFAHRRALRGIEVAAFDLRLRAAVPRIIFSAALMAVFLWACDFFLSPLFVKNSFLQIAALMALVFGGGGVYFIAIFASGALKFREIKAYVLKR